jgi:hypothetical protein
VETHDLAGKRIDDDARLSRHEKEHVVGTIEIFDDRLARLVAPPATNVAERK